MSHSAVTAPPEQRRSAGHAEIRAGWRTAAPACAAVIPMGAALGVLVVQSGLAWWWATIIAAFVFAGSLEFLLVGLFAAAAPLAQVALASVLVNFRHVFYALSFPLHRVTGRGWKAYSTFSLTDEAYALTASPAAAGWSRPRILAIQASFHLAWVSSVTAGALLGILIPPQVKGLGFAVTALFVVLAIEGFRARRSIPAPVLALCCAAIAAVTAPSNMLAVAMGLFVVLLVVGYLVTRKGTPADD